MVTFSLQDISDNRTFFEEIYRQRYGWTATELNDHDLLKWVNEHYRWIPFSSEYRKVVQIPIILNRTFLLENTGDL